MKAEVLQEDLAKTLNKSARFVANKSTLPILSNFLLIAKDGKLQIQSTNLEMSIVTNLGAKIEEEGKIAIPAKIMTDLVSNLPKSKIKLETDKENLLIKCAGFDGKIPTTQPDDFPKIPDSINESNAFSINADKLSSNLAKVLAASSLDETRPVLNGVLFVFKEDLLTLVASDGYRLSKIDVKLDKKIKSPDLIIPRQSLIEIIKDSNTNTTILAEVKETENQLVAKIGDSYLTTRLIDGKFPDYEKIIPQNSEITINTDKNDLSRAIKLASVFAREEGNAIRMKITNESVEIKSEGASGNQKGIIDSITTGAISNNDPLEVSFNYKFVEDFINLVNGESVEIKLIDPVSPAVFQDPKDKNFLHLIMPIRIQN